jgi:hypothetical protein
MQIIWNITQLERRVESGHVFTACWKATATEGDHSTFAYSTCRWEGDTPAIPYESLTEETVLNWVWASGVDKEAIERSLIAQIEAQKNPVISTGIPW